MTMKELKELDKMLIQFATEHMDKGGNHTEKDRELYRKYCSIRSAVIETYLKIYNSPEGRAECLASKITECPID